MFRISSAVIVTALLVPAVVLGHYPWFLPDPEQAPKGTVRFVFEDGLAAGTGEYLGPFIKNATYWLRTTDKKEPTPVSFEEVKKGGKQWLAFPVKTAPGRAIDCYCKWGVYQGKLLHYYARHLDVTSPKELDALARAEKLRFDLVPRVNAGALEIQVLWDGKPSAGKSVLVAGPQQRVTLTSDAQGLVRFTPSKAGLYALRTQFIEPEPSGTEDGQGYKGLRQTATLTINWPIGEK